AGTAERAAEDAVRQAPVGISDLRRRGLTDKAECGGGAVGALEDPGIGDADRWCGWARRRGRYGCNRNDRRNRGNRRNRGDRGNWSERRNRGNGYNYWSGRRLRSWCRLWSRPRV